MYDVTKYGIIGDGLTDNALKFNQLINMVHMSGGGTIFLPSGVYLLQNQLEWKSDVSLIGEGNESSILKTVMGTKDIPINDVRSCIYSPNRDKKNILRNCNFKDFKIDVSDVYCTVYKVENKGIYIKFMENCKFEDITIYGSCATGLGADFLKDVIISGVKVINCGRMWGIKNGSTETDDYNENVYHAGGAGIGIGTGGLPDENFIVTNCTAENCGHYGIFVEDQATFGEGYYRPKGQIISNNIVRNGRCNGIGFKGGDNVIIDNNIIYNNSQNGMYISWKIQDSIISNNSITNNTRGINATTDGKVLSNVEFKDNIIKNNSKEGVLLAGKNGGGFNKFEFSNNNISFNEVGISGIGVDDLSIFNNIVKSNVKIGVSISSAKNNSLIGNVISSYSDSLQEMGLKLNVGVYDNFIYKNNNVICNTKNIDKNSVSFAGDTTCNELM